MKKHLFAKTLVAVILALVLSTGQALPAFASTAQATLTVEVDGVEIAFPDQEPVNIGGTVFVPVYGVFTHMGFAPGWYPATREALLTKGDTVVVIPADGTYFTVNGVTFTPEQPQRLINGRLMLPLRAVAQALGATPYWCAETQTAHIFTAKSPEPQAEQEEQEDEQDETETAVSTGFARYYSSRYRFSISHPEHWLLSGTMLQEEMGIFLEMMGIDINELLGEYDDTLAAWYDPITMSHMNIMVEYVDETYIEIFQDEIFKFIFGEMIDLIFSIIFEDYERTTDIEGTTLGGNYFVYFEANLSFLEIPMSKIQAISIAGNHMYTFTFIAPSGDLDVDTFMYMMASFEA